MVISKVGYRGPIPPSARPAVRFGANDLQKVTPDTVIQALQKMSSADRQAIVQELQGLFSLIDLGKPLESLGRASRRIMDMPDYEPTDVRLSDYFIFKQMFTFRLNSVLPKGLKYSETYQGKVFPHQLILHVNAPEEKAMLEDVLLNKLKLSQNESGQFIPDNKHWAKRCVIVVQVGKEPIVLDSSKSLSESGRDLLSGLQDAVQRHGATPEILKQFVDPKFHSFIDLIFRALNSQPRTVEGSLAESPDSPSQ